MPVDHTPEPGSKAEMLAYQECECGKKHLAKVEVPASTFLEYLNMEEILRVEAEEA